MATVTLVSRRTGPAGWGDITIFASEDLAKKSIEFSCHKLEGKVTYEYDADDPGTLLATCPNDDVMKIEEVHLFDRVTHL